MRLRGTETVSLTQDIDSGTWTYVGNNDLVADTFTIIDFGATDYFNLTVASLTFGLDTFELATAKVIAGNLVISAGTFDDNANTVTFSGVGTQTLTTNNQTFSSIVHSGSGTLQLSGNSLTVSTDFTNSAGTFDLNDQDWTMTGAAFSNDGIVRLRGSQTITGLTQDIDSGTWRYAGDGDSAADTFAINDFGVTDYFNLVIASTDSTDIYQLGAATSVAGAMTVSAGTFDANANTHDVTGLTTVSGGTYAASTAAQTLTAGLTVSGGAFSGSSGDVLVPGNVIFSSGTLIAPSGDFTVGGDWTRTGSGTFTPGTNTVTFNAAAGTQTLDHGGSIFYSIAHTGAGTLSVAEPLDMNGSFSQTAGTFDAPDSMIIGGDFLISGGTFNHNNGRVNLDTAATAVIDAPGGVLDFYDFHILTPGKTVQFTAGETFNVNGTWDVRVAPGLSRIRLQSTSPGFVWSVNAPVADINRVDVSDSVNLTGVFINPPFGLDGGNNSFWFSFTPEPDPGIGNVSAALNANNGLGISALDAAQESDGEDLTEEIQEFIAEKKRESVWNENVSEDSSSEVYVEEGAVYVTAIDGSEEMIYDGESMSVRKGATEIMKRGIYVSSEDGILALRGVTYETLKEFRLKAKPSSLAASYDGRSVYAGTGKKKGIMQIETKEFGTRDINGLKNEAAFIVLNKKGDRAFVGNTPDDLVAVYDMKQQKLLKEIHVGSMPTQAALSMDQTQLFVVERLDGTVSRYDAETGRKTGAAKAGISPFGIALSLDGKLVYVTDTLGNRVIVVDAVTMKHVRSISVGRAPYAIQVNPKNSKRFYVANRGSGSISIVNADSATEMGSIDVDGQPSDIAVLPENNRLYVTNEFEDYMSIIDLKERKTTQKIKVGLNPNKVVISAPPKPGS